jgi:hypothetical protein
VQAWQPNVRAAVAYAHTRAGVVSFAVRTEHRQWGWRVTRTVPSASVLKAMLLVAYLDDRPVRGRALGASDHRLIDPMIQRSDNEAATRVLGFVGGAGVYGVARRAGMRRFTLDPIVWGLSRIDAADQARFFLHIDGDVVSRHRAPRCTCWRPSSRLSAGASAGFTCPAGRSTSRAAGERGRGKSSTRWCSCATGRCACPQPY